VSYTGKFDVNDKKTRTDLKLVSMVAIATVAILTIGSTSTTNVHAQVDCSSNPDDPSCQGSGGSTSSPPNHTLYKIIVAGGAIILGHPELSPLGQIICEP